MDRNYSLPLLSAKAGHDPLKSEVSMFVNKSGAWSPAIVYTNIAHFRTEFYYRTLPFSMHDASNGRAHIVCN